MFSLSEESGRPKVLPVGIGEENYRVYQLRTVCGTTRVSQGLTRRRDTFVRYMTCQLRLKSKSMWYRSTITLRGLSPSQWQNKMGDHQCRIE